MPARVRLRCDSLHRLQHMQNSIRIAYQARRIGHQINLIRDPRSSGWVPSARPCPRHSQCSRFRVVHADCFPSKLSYYRFAERTYDSHQQILKLGLNPSQQVLKDRRGKEKINLMSLLGLWMPLVFVWTVGYDPKNEGHCLVVYYAHAI